MERENMQVNPDNRSYPPAFPQRAARRRSQPAPQAGNAAPNASTIPASDLPGSYSSTEPNSPHYRSQPATGSAHPQAYSSTASAPGHAQLPNSHPNSYLPGDLPQLHEAAATQSGSAQSYSSGAVQVDSAKVYRPAATDTEPASPAPQKRKRRRFDLLGLIGELLITAGLLGCLFAFWDIYVTDWQVSDFKKQALQDFKKEIKACPARVSHDLRYDAPPTSLLKDSGQAMGALHIPKWNYMVLPIKEGTDQPILDSGAAGHYSLTALPGQIGNFSVAAHRLSYGSSFNQIETLADQDPVVVETPDAWIIYQVVSREIVKPDAVQVIAPVPNRPFESPTERFMTMTTCHPEYGNWERFIVHLKFSHWIPRDSGIPEELAAGGKACTD